MRNSFQNMIAVIYSKLDARRLGDLSPKEGFAFACVRGKGDDDRIRRQEFTATKLIQILLELCFVQLVDLGGNDQIGDAVGIEPIEHQFVIVRHAGLAIDQLNNKLEQVSIGVLSKIAIGQLAPLFLVLRGAFRIAIARHIHQEELFVDIIKIDGDGLAWSGADSGEAFSIEQGVDQRAFSDIGSS